MPFLTVFFVLPMLVAGPDEIDLFGESKDSSITIIGISQQDQPSYTASSPTSGLRPTVGPTDVPVIKDSTGSFCVSDQQSGVCIPDPGSAGPAEDAEPTVVDVVAAAAAQIERDIARLGVQPARINLQPAGGDVLVNIDTIFYTEAEQQYLATTVLGRSVTIEVTPAWFEWDFGDGSAPHGTSDQGAPFPDQTIRHVYRSAGDHTITLRTAWSARFRVEGVSNWIPVSGQPVTVDEAGPIRSVTKTNRLVRVD